MNNDINFEEKNEKLIKKYQRLANKATFENNWLRRIKNADYSKSLYENHITTGTSIDGKCIKLSTIRTYCGESIYINFIDAIKKRKEYHSPIFRYGNYDGSLDCYVRDNDGFVGGFSKECRFRGKGYYYLLINDDTFIGYDID